MLFIIYEILGNAFKIRRGIFEIKESFRDVVLLIFLILQKSKLLIIGLIVGIIVNIDDRLINRESKKVILFNFLIPFLLLEKRIIRDKISKLKGVVLRVIGKWGII